MALAFLQEAHSTSDLTTYTFSAQALGAASADRYIIVTAAGRKAGASTTISSITVGGVTATIVVQRTNTITNTAVSGIAIAAVPTGTTGDVVVTFGAGMARCGIALWAVTGLASDTPTDTDSSVATAPTVNLDVVAGGFAIGCAYDSASVGASATWAGITEQYDNQINDGGVVNTWTGASDTFVSVQTGLTMTATFTGSPAECTGSFAAWSLGSPAQPVDEDCWQVPAIPGLPIVPPFQPRVPVFQDTDDTETAAPNIDDDYWQALVFKPASTVSRLYFIGDDDLPATATLPVEDEFWRNLVQPVVARLQKLYPVPVEDERITPPTTFVDDAYWQNMVAPVAARMRQLNPLATTDDIVQAVVFIIRGRLYAGSLQPNLLTGSLEPSLLTGSIQPNLLAETLQ